MLTIAESRVLPLQGPRTLQEIADELGGLSRERVRQLETKLIAAIRRELPWSSAVARTARLAAAQLGAASELRVLSQGSTIFHDLDIDPTSRIGLTILWLAGPYETRADWLIRRPAQAVIGDTKAALTSLTADGRAALSDAEAALAAHGIPVDQARSWIVAVSAFRIEGDYVIRWSGSMGDKAASLLEVTGEPMTAEDLGERIGVSNLRSLQGQLSTHPRIKRTGVRHYGLREWDHDEYTNAIDEIAQELERQGGAAPLEHLVSVISRRYGLAEASVRSYASSNRFGRDGKGWVSLERASESRESIGRRPEMTRGVFLHRGAWTLRLRVSRDMLRGSGFPVPAAFARVIGLEPLTTTHLTFGDSSLAAGWMGLQPTFGSVRRYLDAMGAAEGDLLFLSYSDSELSASHLPRTTLDHVAGVPKLALEFGLPATAGLDAIASALGLEPNTPPAEVAHRLMARGEAELAALLEPSDEEPLVLSLDSARYVDVKWSY